LIFVAVGFTLSAVFLVRNLYPVLSATDVRTSKILLIVIIALHAGLAIAIKVLFFAHGSPAAGTNPPVNEAPPASPPTGSGDNQGIRFTI
jgi:protein YIPF1/2